MKNNNFLDALYSVFPCADDVFHILLTHRVECTCEVSSQAWRTLSGMCSTMAVYKDTTRRMMADISKETAENMTQKEILAKYNEIHQEVMTRTQPEIDQVISEFKEFERIKELHIKEIQEQDEKAGIKAKPDEIRGRVIKIKAGEEMPDFNEIIKKILNGEFGEL